MRNRPMMTILLLSIVAASGCGMPHPAGVPTHRAAVAPNTTSQGLLLVEAPAALRGNGAIALAFAFPKASGYQVEAVDGGLAKLVVSLESNGQTVASQTATAADAANGTATVKFADLKAGTYTVSVEAQDATGASLGQASGDAKVAAGQTSNFHLDLSLQQPTDGGTGGLNLSIGIQDGASPSPAPSVAPSAKPTVTPSVAPSPVASGNWTLVFNQDFKDMTDVVAMQSDVKVNDQALPSDSTNKALQTPSLKGDVELVSDPNAEDGHALAIYTRQEQYQTSSGTVTGWTNGRMDIANHDQAPPVRIRTRLRMTASKYAKSAVMWWPANGGWPWEVDFAETAGGDSLTTAPGNRQVVQENWHADLNHDGKATEQLQGQIAVDATQYHVYDLFIQPDHMWIEVDGVKKFETTDKKWIPTGPGKFSIGKALTGRRDVTGRTEDAVFVDSLQIFKQ